MTGSVGRSVGRAVVIFGGLGGLLWWAVGSPPASIFGMLSTRPGEFDGLLVAVSGAVAWLCLSWFGLVVSLQLLALGSGAIAGASRRAARRLTPRFMLCGARWLVGVTLLAGPLNSGMASAVPVGVGSASPTPATVLSLERPALPNLDRPVALPSPAPPAPAASSPARPAAPTSSATRPTRPTLTRPAASAPILTGTPHRETPGARVDSPQVDSAYVDSAYVVRRGDNLWDIAARHLGPNATTAEIARAWPRWYAANRAAIGANPQLIHPGLVLHAPRS